MDAFPLTLIASVPTSISPHRYVLSPTWIPTPSSSSHLLPTHLAWVPLISPAWTHAHSHGHMPTCTDTCPLAQTHAHSHRHMPTHTDTCPLTQTHAHSPTRTD